MHSTPLNSAHVPPPLKVGVELETIAPRGLSRKSLANLLAGKRDGAVTPIFKRQSELSAIPGMKSIDNLTLGFRADLQQGLWVECVDDITLSAELNFRAAPEKGWFRIVCDDHRILDLIEAHANPGDPIESVLEPIAKLWKTKLIHTPEGPIVLNSKSGQTIAMLAQLPSERHRPCEVVTSPIEGDPLLLFEFLYESIDTLGFTGGKESATHIHFDGARLKNAKAFKNLVCFFASFGPLIKKVCKSNPHCKRLGYWPVELLQCVTSAGFESLSWQQAQEKLKNTKPSKYCDFNVANLIMENLDKPTFEVRVLPHVSNAKELHSHVVNFAQIICRCADTAQPAIPLVNPKRTMPAMQAEVFLELLAGTPLPEGLSKSEASWIELVNE